MKGGNYELICKCPTVPVKELHTSNLNSLGRSLHYVYPRELRIHLRLLLYLKRFSAAFQLITFQIALKYSALRFW